MTSFPSKFSPTNWPIWFQLVSFSILVSVGTIGSLGFMATKSAQNAITEMQSETLVSTLNERSAQLTQQLKMVQDEILVLASDPKVAQAAQQFATSFESLPSELTEVGFTDFASISPISSYFDQIFAPALKENGKEYRGSRSYLPKSESALAAQRMYIADNNNQAGSKHLLNFSTQAVSYNAAHERFHPYFRSVVEQFGFYDFFLFNNDGDMVYSVFKETDFATNFMNGPFASSGLGDVFREAMNLNQGQFSIVDFGEYTPSYGAPAWFIAAPLFIEGERVGVVSLQIPTDYMNTILGNPIGETGQTVLFGQDGKLRSMMPNMPESTVIETKLTNDAIEVAMTTESGSLSFIDERGVPVMGSFKHVPIAGIDWYLLATIDEAEVLEPAHQMAWGIFWNGLIVASVVIPFAFLLSRSFAKPFSILLGKVQSIASGNLTEHVHLQRKDEIGKLAGAINDMSTSLATMLSEVQTTTLEVSTAATQIAAGAEEMSSGMEHQRGQTSVVSAAIEEMSVSVAEVAKKSVDASNKSKEGGQHATQGGVTVNHTIDGMNAISQQVNESVIAVGELSKRSEQIGEIIEVINDIADQTNLLALNAAIEAARAGEHGRGFAVVADEVRKLAERTTNATEEVADSIRSIQTETKQAITRMESSQDQVTNGVNLAEEAGIALEQIVCGSNEIVPMIQGIAAAAEEQSAAANEIAISIEQIDAVTNESAQGVTQIAESASMLSEKSKSLQDLVHRFKLS